MTDKPKFVYVTYIATTLEKAWEALTNPEFTKQYWAGRQLDSDWQVGSPVKALKEDGALDWHGEVLQFEPPQVLSYTFRGAEEECGEEPPSRVTFDLRPYGDAVRLTVTHENLESEQYYRGIAEGWSAILSSMKSLLETGQPISYPAWQG